MPPPITSGLLWSTDAAIDFAVSGPIVPAIPMPRAAGPVYFAMSFRSDGDGMILRIGNPEDYYYGQNSFQLTKGWGNFVFEAAPGWPNNAILNDTPPAPTEHVWEFWTSASDADLVRHDSHPGWFPDPMPALDVVATSHLFIGYRPNEGTPMERGAGRIHRIAVYDRVPTSAERAQLVAWVESEDPAGATIDRQAGLVAASHVAAQRTVRRQRSAVVVAGSAVAASASTARRRGAQILATSSLAAAAAPVRDRGASVGAGSTVAARASVSRLASATLSARSAVSAQGTITRTRSARVGATSALSATAGVSGVISASASIKAASSVQARPSRAIHRSAVIEAGSSVRAGSGRSVHASVGVIASSAIAARARRIVARGVTVTAAGAVHARAEVQRGSGITIAARSSITAQRRVLALRAANISAASVVAAAAIIVRPVMRYAYPGDPQGGTLSPSLRGGVLAPSIRSGTIQRP